MLGRGGGPVVPRHPLQHAELTQGIGLVEPRADDPEQLLRPLVAGGGGRVIPGQLLYQAQIGEGDGLCEPIARAAGQRQRLPVAGGGGRVLRRPAAPGPDG